MSTPDDRRYTPTHEWISIEGDTATIGITRHAVDQLTDVTYVELRPSGTALDAGDAIGEVESVKTTSDVYSPVAGEIIEINDDLEGNPGALNDDPYSAGWLVKIKVTDSSPIDGLADAATYDAEYAS